MLCFDELFQKTRTAGRPASLRSARLLPGAYSKRKFGGACPMRAFGRQHVHPNGFCRYQDFSEGGSERSAVELSFVLPGDLPFRVEYERRGSPRRFYAKRAFPASTLVVRIDDARHIARFRELARSSTKRQSLSLRPCVRFPRAPASMPADCPRSCRRRNARSGWARRSRIAASRMAADFHQALWPGVNKSHQRYQPVCSDLETTDDRKSVEPANGRGHWLRRHRP